MKLFTIGDSVSQGFMSLAAARTDLSYSSLIARAMGLKLGKDYSYPKGEYHYPEWDEGGLPLNVENILRRLNERYGATLGSLEVLGVLHSVNEMVSRTKTFYEIGGGSAETPAPNKLPFYHNVAVQGFDIADSWLVTPRLCREEIGHAKNNKGTSEFSVGPSAYFYRTALRVLDPALEKGAGRAYVRDDFSQLRWLEEHAHNDGGVENLILWLGANNALGTMISLKIRQTPGDGVIKPEEKDHIERDQVRQWNLWHPDDFAREYRMLLEKTDAIMAGNEAPNWKVFLGTVPVVTIAPLVKGVGDTTEMQIQRPVLGPDGAVKELDETSVYYRNYVWFPFDEGMVNMPEGNFLTIQDVLHIDDCIREYNRTIGRLVQEFNGKHPEGQRYFVADIADAMQRMAWKRNGGQPTYDFPEYFRFKYPKVNTKYYYADAQGQLRQGGLFSLDGVHPSAIAHGLLAREFMKVMGGAGVAFQSDLSWPEIFASDTLYTEPITLMQWLYEHEQVAERVLEFIRFFRRRD